MSFLIPLIGNSFYFASEHFICFSCNGTVSYLQHNTASIHYFTVFTHAGRVNRTKNIHLTCRYILV